MAASDIKRLLFLEPAHFCSVNEDFFLLVGVFVEVLCVHSYEDIAGDRDRCDSITRS